MKAKTVKMHLFGIFLIIVLNGTSTNGILEKMYDKDVVYQKKITDGLFKELEKIYELVSSKNKLKNFGQQTVLTIKVTDIVQASDKPQNSKPGLLAIMFVNHFLISFYILLLTEKTVAAYRSGNYKEENLSLCYELLDFIEVPFWHQNLLTELRRNTIRLTEEEGDFVHLTDYFSAFVGAITSYSIRMASLKLHNVRPKLVPFDEYKKETNYLYNYFAGLLYEKNINEDNVEKLSGYFNDKLMDELIGIRNRNDTEPIIDILKHIERHIAQEASVEYVEISDNEYVEATLGTPGLARIQFWLRSTTDPSTTDPSGASTSKYLEQNKKQRI